MQPTIIMYPVFAQVALTFGLLLWMRKERRAAIDRGETKRSDIALRERAWPARATQIANAFHNQLEIPVLFYAVVAFALITSRVDFLMVLLAWAFVVLRLAHAYIHTTDNDVPRRGLVFRAGAIVLFVMWIYYFVQFLTAGV